MTTERNPSEEIDWSLATWEGSRRAQLRRWADLPLENIVAALEEMEDLSSLLHVSSPVSNADEEIVGQANPASLPNYPSDYVRSVHARALVDLMTRDEDRVPRNVIEVCAARADEFVPIFTQMLDDPRFWSDGGSLARGWWLKLHAIMVLGLIPTLQAGEFLARFMRQIAETEDDDFGDWCAGYWPALFRNKPAATSSSVSVIAEDETLGWYIRSDAFEVVLAFAQRESPAALEAALDWLAEHAGAPSAVVEDASWRAMLALTLLDFPRERHRILLAAVERGQPAGRRAFNSSEIAAAYERGTDLPTWLRFADPWSFYTPSEIEARQARWAVEALAEDEALALLEDEVFDDELVARPFVRDIPKLGRNDPCYCGSGKKYKKCHLALDGL